MGNGLDNQMRQLLAEAKMLSEGGTQNLDPKTSHGKAESKILSRRGPSVYEEVASRFRHARTRDEKMDAILWAKREIKQHRGLYKPKPAPTVKDRVLTEWTDLPAKDVAAIFGVNERTVRRWRETAA